MCVSEVCSPILVQYVYTTYIYIRASLCFFAKLSLLVCVVYASTVLQCDIHMSLDLLMQALYTSVCACVCVCCGCKESAVSDVSEW